MANENFTHILRVLNTNVDGKQKIMYALTAIRGIGRRFSNICCKKAEVDLNKRAGELSPEELESIMTIVANPRAYKVPDWFLNRQKDVRDGRFSQVGAHGMFMPLLSEFIYSRRGAGLFMACSMQPAWKWGPASACGHSIAAGTQCLSGSKRQHLHLS